ncbi:hypothetical protein [Spirosoma utsteinense]|uniref:Uncharacterized protein n=1 Tax=Spirosoma utsteinense TaxID=2585773 RepID=A0ABR6WEW5_9BACT|nr:hypothetical protein [Spirosoma utsteinense]MBC3788921.1 hypothetical protein [Spirosoma utsteinense]MBC3794839.1 hypothetical protein [Spirosoma utsteinense]
MAIGLTPNKTLRKENQQSWSITKELELSQSVTVSAGIPEIAEVATTFTWRISQSTTQSSSQTIITEFVIGDSGTLEVGQSVNLAALVQQGSLVNIAYTGKITFNLKSGGSYTSSFNGVYSGVAYTGVVIKDLTTNQVISTGSIRHFVA